MIYKDRIKLELVDDWITALESGEYEQTTGNLHMSGGGYCCLGVLLDVAAKKGHIEGHWSPARQSGYAVDFIMHTSGAVWRDGQWLPQPVQDMVGLTEDGTPVDSDSPWSDSDGDSWPALATFNDNYEGEESVFLVVATMLRAQHLPRLRALREQAGDA